MMLQIKIPAFGEERFSDFDTNSFSRVVRIADATPESFTDYCELFVKNGLEKRCERFTEYSLYAAFEDEVCCVFVNYFNNTRKLQIVIENDSNYFSFENFDRNITVPAQITQVHLEDFGMSYAVRLLDGRFIVIDGGRAFEPDAKRLYDVLKTGSPYDKPVIAAWIMSHPHSDHFHCLFPFVDNFGDEVEIEKIMFNFPNADDLEHYPKLSFSDARFNYDTASTVNIPRLFEYIKNIGAPIYTPHTGQIFELGGAKLEILSSMDDTYGLSSNINMASLTFRMELGGQTVLWTTDSSFGDSKLCECYGGYLKSDILQVPHHGFGCGSVGAQINAYKLIDPDVCLLPVNDYNAYTVVDIWKDGTRYLMTKLHVKEMITGEITRTLTLPYKPDSNGVKELERNCSVGFDRAGACTWIYMGLNTARKEDFVFQILNASGAQADINIELFYEDPKQRVRFINVKVPAATLKRVNIADENDVESELLYFNWMSLKTVGIPEAVDFAVRFISNVPVVVSHKDHQVAYRSNLN